MTLNTMHANTDIKTYGGRPKHENQMPSGTEVVCKERSDFILSNKFEYGMNP